ncbi:MAG: PDZ domain-containing protein, partial [Candidatus Methylomirabilis sp.]|nr:PDZ domain-containing protein [Deltaproteobacteria bacterium]
AVGSKADVEVLRKGKRKTIEVTIGELKDDEARSGGPGGSSQSKIDEKLGLAVQTLTSDTAEQVGLPRDAKGVIVVGVDGGGPAAEAGIRRGDAITEVNRVEIDDRDGFYAALDKSKVDEERKTRTILFLVQRGDGARYAAVKTPLD